jgi:hypothetical protein
MRHLLLAVSLLILRTGLAQTPAFSHYKAPYQTYNDGVRLAKDSIWDEPFNLPINDYRLPLGFNLNLFGVEWDTVYLDQCMIVIPGDTSEVWAGLYHDFCDRGKGGRRPISPISHKTVGSSPNRIVKIQWRNVGFYDDYIVNSRCIDSANVQIWIYEGLNKVEVHFGKSYLANRSLTLPDGVGVVCGEVGDLNSKKGFALTGNTESPAIGDFETGFMGGWPKDSQVYVFQHNPANKTKKTELTQNSYYHDNVLYSRNAVANKVEVFDNTGRLIYTSAETSNSYTLPELQKGVYSAILHFGQRHEMVRFISS